MPAPCELVKKCDHCPDDIEVDEPSVELFFGVLGRSPKAGFLMVVNATAEPERAVTLHPRCVVGFCLENIDDALPDEMTVEYCPNCESKLDPRFCPSCGMKVD